MKKWLSLIVMTSLLLGAAYLAVATEAGRDMLNSSATTRAMLAEIDAMLAKDSANPELLAKREEVVRDLAAAGEAVPAVQVIPNVNEEKSLDYLRSIGENVPDAPSDYIARLLMRLEAGEQLTDNEKFELEASGVFDEHGRNPLDNQGGPDTYGYTWVDNLSGDTATYAWEDIVGAPGAVNLTVIGNSDDAATSVPLTFSFPFYATSVTTIYPSTNGAIGMTSVSSLGNTCTLPTTAFPSGGIWPFWDDLHPGRGGTGVSATVSDSGSIWYKDEGNRVIVQWDSVGRFSPSFQATYSFQAILYADGKIKLQYKDITRYAPSTTLPTATIGIQQGSTAPNNSFLVYDCATTGSASQDTIRSRAVWFRPPTVAPSGRCCYWDGAADQCVENTLVECSVLGGSWLVGVTCAGSPCPVGRCCYNNGNNCGDFTLPHCSALTGVWTTGQTCAGNPCPLTIDGGETCADAVLVNAPATIRGTTAGNVDDDPGFQCALGSGDPYEGSNTAGDEWYSITGTGDSITVSLCNTFTTFDTQILVVCSDDCLNFNCVAGNDDATCTASGLRSTASFCSEAGRNYYIVVDGWGSATGPFELYITVGGPCTGAVNCTPFGRCCYLDNGAPACVDNLVADCNALNGQWNQSFLCAASPCPTARCCYLVNGISNCDDVTDLECQALNGIWTSGSTCAANPCPVGRCCYLSNGVGTCATNTSQECAALTGTWTSTTTCEATPCPVGRCCYVVGGIGSCETNMQLECVNLGGTWSSTTTCEATPCPIGRCCYDDNGNAACVNDIQEVCTILNGVWNGTVTCETSACPTILQGSDLCADAVLIPVFNQQYAGTNVGATPETGLPACASWYNAAAPGVWYKLVGTGNTITVSFCDPITTYDSEVGVFCHPNCDSLVCVTSDDDFCTTPGLASQVSWCSVLGAEYKVLVAAFSTGTGTFAFTVTDDGVPCVATVVCPTAPAAPCDPVVDLAPYVATVGNVNDHLRIHFTAPQDETYFVWSTTNPNNDGNPDSGADPDWTLEATLPGLLAGAQTWDAPAGFPGTFKVYVVTADCPAP